MFNDKIFRISFFIIGTLLIIGAIVVNLVFYGGDTKPTYTSMPKQVKVTNISTDPNELSVDRIFINLRSNKYKILKADIAVKMKTSAGKKALQSDMNNVRNALLQYIASIDANSLDTPKGKEKLKNELLDVLEESFGYEIESIYWKNIILSP